ncbi:MAG: type II secretion system protein GspG [Deltaproteobacteria bacterium]|nr:type II secretion system protein GspG [Deltaproteobacteria bacterium]
MAKKMRYRRDVLLPWERRNVWFTELLSGSMWRALLLALAALGMTLLAWRVAGHRARVRMTRASIAEVQRAIVAFRAEVGRCPRSTVELVHPPRAISYQLNELPDDGWGRPLYVRCPDRRGIGAALVVSAGPSGSFSKDDNIFN